MICLMSSVERSTEDSRVSAISEIPYCLPLVRRLERNSSEHFLNFWMKPIMRKVILIFNNTMLQYLVGYKFRCM